MKKILFSPIGSTDPIAGQHDGAMLHIIRKYKPEKVYVYMSKEMGELEDKDMRYSYCLEQLRNHLKLEIEVEYIRRDDLVDVHIFDYFLAEFKSILKELCIPETEVLLNVSSGTPAMKSALQILAATFDNQVIPIQVHTPKKELNDREDIKGNYSVELQWELNLDNEENYTDRCTVSPVVNMMNETKSTIIKQMVEEYDYVAAYRVAKTVQGGINQTAEKLIRAGIARLKLDKSACSKLCNEVGYDMYPVKRTDQWALFEYMMILRIKIIKEEYADFIRAISPLFFSLMEKIIRNSGQIDLDKYRYEELVKRNKHDTKSKINRIVKWRKRETEKNPIFQSINGSKNTDTVIFTEDYTKLINLLNIDGKTKTLVNEMRNVEKNIRNSAAHSIVNITDEVVETYTGMNSWQIFSKIRNLITASGVNISKESLNTYDDLNNEIKRNMDIVL